MAQMQCVCVCVCVWRVGGGGDLSSVVALCGVVHCHCNV